jgi:TonB family protein
MRNLSVVALFALMVTGVSGGQQATSSVPDSTANAQPAPVKAYAVGPDVTAPELISHDLGPFSTEKCRKKVNGKYVFSLVVDKDGKPSEVMLLEPLGTELGRFAHQIVEADRFKPGIRDDAPVAVKESLEIYMHTCVVQTKEEAADKTYRLHLRSQPEQKFRALPRPEKPPALDKTFVPATSIDGVPIYRVGNGVSFPIVLNTAEAEFSDEARRAKFQGVCIISVIIDTEGKPRNLHVARKLGMGLDEKAMEAVSQWRFKPAMKDGVPVPVGMNIEVSFQLR